MLVRYNRRTFAADGVDSGAVVDTVAAEPVEGAPVEAVATEAEPAAKPEPKQPAWEVKRINEITREKHEESRLRQAAERELSELRAKVARPATPESDLEARAEALAEQKFSRFQEDNKQRAFTDSCNRVADAGATEYKDFDDTIATLNATGVMRPELIEAALEIADKDAHKVLYALGKNPAEAARIAALSPVRMAAALAKIAVETKSAPAAPSPRAVSKAPAPIDTVQGSSGAAETDPEKMSAEQYAAWRDKKRSSKK